MHSNNHKNNLNNAKYNVKDNAKNNAKDNDSSNDSLKNDPGSSDRLKPKFQGPQKKDAPSYNSSLAKESSDELTKESSEGLAAESSPALTKEEPKALGPFSDQAALTFGSPKEGDSNPALSSGPGSGPGPSLNPSSKVQAFGPLALILILLATGLGALLVIPMYPGFYVLPWVTGLLILLFRGPKRLKADLRALGQPGRLRFWRRVLGLLVALALLLAVGSLTALPIYNLSGLKGLVLSPQEVATLDKLPDETVVEAFLTPAGEAKFGSLLNLYARASTKITIRRSPGPARSLVEDSEVKLVLPDLAIIRSGPYQETVAPLTYQGLKEAFYRLSAPTRLVYSLIGDGEKSVQDPSPKGLSLWAKALEKRKIYLHDYFWAPGEPLPTQFKALLLMGPTVSLSPEKNAALTNFLAQGGRLLVAQDPLAPGVEPAVFQELGLTLPDGLMADPQTAWAGTNDFFPVSQKFANHPATLGLSRPVVWPLAGAILVDQKPPRNDEADDPLAATVSALALSSPESFLETDLLAIAKRRPTQDDEADLKGPLALAAGADLKSGGRLVLLADSDLATNVFYPHQGNQEFLDGVINWLIDENLAPDSLPKAILFNVTQSRARLFFWLPVVVWPGLMVLIWGLWRWRRGRGEGKNYRL
ncbi:MAG: GldG family protein [Deltaproteobacteria bacterium]|jgi:hypothetical protein|nr:GldG family protein [Deltaproteobacteria bacterium]